MAVPAQVPEGGTCFADAPLECIGGYCEFDACNGPGICVTAALEGELCESVQCAEGLDCAWNGMEYRCVVSTPRPVSGLDEPCGDSEICADGLYCAWTGVEYLCQAKVTGACDGWDACVQGYRCIDGTCTSIKAVGQACTTGTGECVYGALCQAPEGSTSGVCAAWPRAGGACGYLGNEESASCIESWCDSGVMNGVALPGRTSALATMAIGPGTCQPYVALGEYCDGHWEACGLGAYCNYGSCAKAYCLPR